jgi:hypothetical protein
MLWETWLTTARACLVVASAIPLCELLERQSRSLTSQWLNRLFWCLLIAPVLFPRLLVAYVWAGRGFDRLQAEAIYDLILLARFVPLGLFTLRMFPAGGPTLESWQTAEMAGNRLLLSQLRRQRLFAAWQRRLSAIGLLGLLVFHEFEISALLKTVTWTDRLFVAHAGGLPLDHSLRLSVGPLLTAGGAVGLFWAIWIWLSKMLPFRLPEQNLAIDARPAPTTATWELVIGWVWPCAACGLVVVYPLVILLPNLITAGSSIWLDGRRWWSLTLELSTGLALSAAAAALVLAVALAVGRRSQQGEYRLPRIAVMGSTLLAGCGSLIVGLCLLSFFQQPMMRLLYDTPVPICLGFALKQWPLAIVLLEALRSQPVDTAEHMSRRLRTMGQPGRSYGQWLTWQSRDRWIVAIYLILVASNTQDVILSSLLAPVGLASGTVRLYNFMHYGRSVSLTLEALILQLVPVVLSLGLWRLLGPRLP